jgi:group I intron endonuclease
MLSSVYKVVQKSTGREYVGITSRPPLVRWKEHLYDAQRARSFLHNAIRKHGEADFEFKVVAELPTFEEAKIAEQILIALERPAFNLTAGGDGTRGYLRSEETRQKLAAGRRGKKHSDETRQKISEAVSAALLGNQRAKGVKHSAETRAKLSALRTGKKYGPRSAETRAKMSAAQMGNKKTLGRKHTEEAKAKMRAARKARELAKQPQGTT